VDDDAWRAAIAVAWKVQDFSVHCEYSQDSIDTYWHDLSSAFEDTFKVAHMICQTDMTR